MVSKSSCYLMQMGAIVGYCQTGLIATAAAANSEGGVTSSTTPSANQSVKAM
jgi:hypothetical protein